MKEYKKQLKEYYDRHVKERNEKVKPEWKLQLRDEFLSIMKERGFETLIEIGAGTGQDSLFFKENGLAITAVDLSEEHVKKCREKGIDAYVMDFSDLQFENDTFDCLYAMNCLLHVPNIEIIGVLEEAKKIVKNEGIIIVCQYGGTNEEGNKAYDGEDERFNSFRTHDAFASYASDAGLKVIRSEEIYIDLKRLQSHFFILGK